MMISCKVFIRFFNNAVYLSLCCLMLPLSAETNVPVGFPDTLNAITLDKVVVTANRFENRVLYCGASAGVLETDDLARFPINGLPELLRYSPGIYATSPEGIHPHLPLISRGFSGARSSSRMAIMIDGTPVGEPESGLFNFTMVPLIIVSSIEIVRGGASSLYGDRAMGGVLNLITEQERVNFSRARIGYGSHNSRIAGIANGGAIGKATYSLYVNNESSDGYRENSDWNALTFGGQLVIPVGASSNFSLRTMNQIHTNNLPGPLNKNIHKSDPTHSLPHFFKDGMDIKNYCVEAAFKQNVNAFTDLDVTLMYRYKDADEIQTVVTPPPVVDMFNFNPVGVYDTTLYGSTANHLLTVDHAELALRMIHLHPFTGIRVTGGIEAGYKVFSRRVSDLYSGFEADYVNYSEKQPATVVSGKGYRNNVAVYISSDIPIIEGIKLLGSVRYDLISDSYDSRNPFTQIVPDKTFSALSPRAALSLSTGESSNYLGSIYMALGRSFAAPTINQRTNLTQVSYARFFQQSDAFDIIHERPFANLELKLQHSADAELGTQHFYRFSPRFDAEISLTGFLSEVKNEIIFDYAAYRFVNIAATRHTGIEAAVNARLDEVWRALINVNYTETRIAGGALDGKRLTGIPSFYHAIKISYTPELGFGGALGMTGASGAYLDSINLIPLDGYVRIAAKIHYRFNLFTLSLNVENLFDTGYSPVGYLHNQTRFYYPAAGRTIMGSVLFEL
jgi:iron complex outermembrane recepter protein